MTVAASMLCAFAACTPSSSPEDRDAVVVGRVGGAPAVSLVRQVRTAPLRLGNETRIAFEVTPGNPLGVVVARPARQILLSIGVRGRVPSTATVRFVVRAKTPTGWQTVFSQAVEGARKWRDHLVTPEEFPSGASEFEFETELAEPNAELSPYFGSVIFSGAPDGSDETRPNIVLMSLDTLGAAYLGSKGELEGVSPAIDEVLRRSGSFSKAFVQFANTLVSHRALFTGRYPSNARSPSLVEQLASNGYLTVAVTENGYVASTFGFASGFDWYDDGPIEKGKALEGNDGPASRTFAEAADTLERLQRVAPLFLFVHTYEVHKPYRPRSAGGKQIAARLSSGDARDYREIWRTRGRGVERPPARDQRRMRALYIGGVRDLDAQVEKFFSRLASFETVEETLVVLTSDHGEAFHRKGLGGHGGLHNDVLRVPLGFHWPGRIPASDATVAVELIDVLPTILDFARVPTPEGLDGQSLAPLLRTGEDRRDSPRTAFSIARKGYAIQTQRFKLERQHEPGSEQLYDLESDPRETRDVAAQHPEKAKRLLAQLELHVQALDGVSHPPGAEDEIDSQTRERLRALGYIE